MPLPQPSQFDGKGHNYTHAANVPASNLSASVTGTWATDVALVNAIRLALAGLLAGAKEAGLMVQD